MRIINIDYNVKQRLNDIVGRTGSGPNGLTPWSVQEAMLSNIERLAAGLSGNSSYGRLLSGLHLSIDGATVTITAGYGITKSGKVIHLQSAVSHSFSGNTYFYLAYNKGPVQDSDPAGIISPFVGSTQSQQLVSDEAGTVYGTGVTWDQIIVTDADGSGQGNSDYIYLGSVISGVVSPSYQRGFVDAVGFNVMGSLAVQGTMAYGYNSTVNYADVGGVAHQAVGAPVAPVLFTIKDGDATNYHHFTIINGLIVAYNKDTTP